MRFKSLLFTLLLAAPPAMAQTFEANVDFDASAYIDVNVAPIGNGVPDVSIFFERLAPYGSWFDDPVYGFVFAPANPGYTPYSNGSWRFTDYGWTWISADPFGWATDHYGRWIWRSRWVWKPDTTWGPAWVQWRQSESAIGWAPLGYEVDAYIPETQWRFIPTMYITARDLPRYYVRADYGRYLRDTRPIARWNRYGQHRWVAGPDRDYLIRHRVSVERHRADLREIGRLDRQERLVAERRAQQVRVQYQDRLRRENQVRVDLDRRRAETERRQVQRATELRQRVEQQRRTERQRVEQQKKQQNEQRQRIEQQKKQQNERQRVEQQKKQQNEQRQRVEQQKKQQNEQRAQQERKSPRVETPKQPQKDQRRSEKADDKRDKRDKRN